MCSEKEEFLKHISEMKLWFIKQDCTESVVEKELGKIKSSESPRITNKTDKDVYLVVNITHYFKTLVEPFIDTLIYSVLTKKLIIAHG